MNERGFFVALAFVAGIGCASAAPRPSGAPAESPPAETKPAVAAAPEGEEEIGKSAKLDPAADAAGTDSAGQVIRDYTDQLRSIAEVDKRTKKGGRDAAKERKIAGKVREFFDFPGLARLSLGRHWRSISAAEQKTFSDLFIDLIEHSYLRRSRNIMGNYELKYGREEVRKGKATVRVAVVRSDANVDITYELHRVGGKWMIYNIILDDVDLIENYRAEFNRIISQRGFGGLLGRMRKKQKEMGEEADTL